MGWRGGIRPLGLSGRKVGQGSSSPSAQRFRARKKHWSQLFVSALARVCRPAKALPSRLDRRHGAGPRCGVATFKPGGGSHYGTVATHAPGTFPQMAMFFFFTT